MNTPEAAPFALGTELQHYKGGRYTVLGSCLIEATLQPGVLYRPLQGDKQHLVWMRPLAEFSEQVNTTNGPVPRFVVIRTPPA